MKKVLYKMGYLIRVTSWENDADNYNTKEINVETEEEARQIVEFANLFRSRNRSSDGIGNLYNPNNTEVEKVHTVFKGFLSKYPDFFDETPEKEEYLMDWMIDFAYDLGLTCGEFYTRVCDKVEVVHLTENVICEEIKFE